MSYPVNWRVIRTPEVSGGVAAITILRIPWRLARDVAPAAASSAWYRFGRRGWILRGSAGFHVDDLVVGAHCVGGRGSAVDWFHDAPGSSGLGTGRTQYSTWFVTAIGRARVRFGAGGNLRIDDACRCRRNRPWTILSGRPDVRAARDYCPLFPASRK